MKEGNTGLLRFDSAIEFKTWKDTPEGYLKIFGTAAVVGVMKYRNFDGSDRLEMLPADTLAESVDAIKNIPIVVEHPLELPKGFVDAKTVQNYQVGEVVGAQFDSEGQRLEVELIIRDARVVAKVKARKLRGLSPGYELDREPAPADSGYEFVQRNRRYNHLALTKAPRHEESVIHLDSADNVILALTQTEKQMPEPDDKNKPVTGAPDAQANLDSLVGEMRAFMAVATKVLDVAQTQTEPKPEPVALDSAEAEIAATELRIQTIGVAEQLGVEFDRAKESTADIRRKVVANQLGESFDSEAADGYIDAAFAFLGTQAQKAKETGNSFDALGASFGNFPESSKPGERSTGFDSRSTDNDFVAVDPTALAHGQAPKATQKEA